MTGRSDDRRKHQRTRVNAAAGSKGGLGGLLAFVYGFFDLVIEWHWRLLASPDVLEEFVVGSVAAFIGAAGIAGWNRDQPSATQPPVIDTAPDRLTVTVIEPVRASEPRTTEPATPLAPKARRWSKRSQRNLAECHADLQRLADYMLAHSPIDLTIIDGHRTEEEQRRHVANGFSQRMDSRHRQVPSLAFDFIPVGGDLDDPKSYAPIVEAGERGAAELGINAVFGHRWGWTDSGHVELDRNTYPDVELG